MKCLLVSAALSLVLMPVIAGAACTAASQVTGATTLSNLLANKTLCALRGADRWQEFHQAGGALIDYKKGPSDPVDPTKQVGTWTVTGNGSGTQVRYNYGQGASYTYKVHTIVQDTSYSLCSGAEDLVVSMRAGQGPC
ncbi:hypothetical protein [Aromatoleum petrolei]|uniref:Secreted protein n=1 Tax=Aromatoleum petrolei TaxID=76116 RepID=A0ABX1MR22_9RHOO|nr:hypothetical protein [Aromatoleum petrolei]NMF90380.1 hypothetical protein [Aromatoleum petrolei]QTQ35726.1 Uncharacterized protein ToN1_15690 [Aromatoleum petrolei]